MIIDRKYNVFLIKERKQPNSMSKGISMFRISSLSAQNEYKSLIEMERNLNLKFMEILKKYGFKIYKGTFISKILKKINAIPTFIYNKSLEYIADLPDYAKYNLKMMEAYNLTGILKVNFTIGEIIKEANELSLNEVSLFLNNVKFLLPTTTLNKNQKLVIIIEPIVNYSLNPISNEISIVVFVKKKGLFSKLIELTRVLIPIVDRNDFDIENNLRKIILLTKFYSFLDNIKCQLAVTVVKEE